jgi:hypothetical protein
MITPAIGAPLAVVTWPLIEAGAAVGADISPTVQSENPVTPVSVA